MGSRIVKRKDEQRLNQKGIALAVVLILSFVCLAIVSTLIYLVIQGTKFSGFYKRYATAHDAAGGGTEITTALILNRGALVIPPGIDFDPSGAGINLSPACVCGYDPDPATPTYPKPTPDTCLCRKLCLPPYKTDGITDNWASAPDRPCDGKMVPIAGPPQLPFGNPDIPPFNLTGVGGREYQVYAKIVDTTIGVTDLSGENLSCGTGVGYMCESIGGAMTPYLYRVEVNVQDAANPVERSRLSILYAY